MRQGEPVADKESCMLSYRRIHIRQYGKDVARVEAQLEIAVDSRPPRAARNSSPSAWTKSERSEKVSVGKGRAQPASAIHSAAIESHIRRKARILQALTANLSRSQWAHYLEPSTGTEGDPKPIHNHASLNHATMGSGREMAAFSARPIRPGSARLATNPANIRHAPIADRLYTAAPHVP